ncbi:MULTISPECIES: S8 family peptidase [Brevibacillus]|uniref:S8 family peptidase n=1 Tax=Brevibacillus TaxID=55080 RepID=UPI0036348245
MKKKIYLVSFKEKTSKRTTLKEVHESNLQKLIKHGAKVQKELKNLPRTFIISDPDESVLVSLRNDPDILVVEENVEDQPLMAQNPPEWPSTLIGLPEFVSRGYTGAGVKVGIIDSGFANHEDIVYAGRYNAYAAVYGYTTPPESDYLGHGTSVAGIIGARNNDKGYVGIAPGASLYCAKITHETGNGLDVAAQIEAIEWLVRQGVKIINCSFGGIVDVESRRIAFRDAASFYDILIICGAGNEGNVGGAMNDNMIYPARYDFVLSVGCLKANKEPAVYSSRGPELDVSAPGHNVMTTIPSSANRNGINHYDISKEYGLFTGTSCATPHVTGLAALYWQMNPSYTANQIKNLILSNVEELGKEGMDVVFGKGMVISPWTPRNSYTGKLTSSATTITGSHTNSNLVNGGVKHFKYVAPTSDRYLFKTTNQMKTHIRVYDESYKLLGFSPYGTVTGVTSAAVFLDAGKTVYISVSGEDDSQTGPFTLELYSATPTVVKEDFEDAQYAFDFSGDWVRTNLERYDGTYSFTNKDISDGQESRVSFNINIPSTVSSAILSMDYKVSSESNYDFFEIFIGGMKVLSVSGNVSWTRFETPVQFGLHTITLRYIKDGGTSSGSDSAFVDNITLKW